MIVRKFTGYLLTLEGGEGSGKSTLLQQIKNILEERGYSVVATREPGGTKLGELIRHQLLQASSNVPIDNMAELLLFLAARAQHVKELIIPALQAGKIVICDRFNDSTIAYQGAARTLDPKMVKKMCETVCGLVTPALTIFLDVSPETGLLRSQRIEKEESVKGKLDRIESESLLFHRKVQKAFKDLAKKEPLRIYTLDAEKPQLDVLKEAIRVIEELILLPYANTLVN